MNPAAAELFPGSLVFSLLGAIWVWALALLLGAAALPLSERDSPGGRGLAWLAFGIFLQTQIWLLISFWGGLRPTVVVGAAATMTAVGATFGWKRVRRAVLQAAARRSPAGTTAHAEDSPWLRRAALFVFGLFLAAVFRFALWPTVFYDDLVYHVAAPRQALLTGSWPAMPGMHYSFMPAGWDAAYLLPLALGGGSGPQLMNLVALGLLAWAVYRLARHGGGPAAASAATMLLVIAPMTGSLGAFAGNDLYVGLALVVALERLLATSGERPLSVGLLTGAAWGAKYSALPAAAGIGLAAVLLRRGSWSRRLGSGALVGAVTVLVPLAWTLRSYVLTGNPIYPAYYGLFGGEYWSPESAAVVADRVSHGGFADRGPMALVLALRDLLFRSDVLGFPSGINPLFVVLGLVGLLMMRRVVGARPLLVAGAVGYVGWCLTSLNLRYALFLLAILAPFAAALIQAGVTAAARPRLRLLARPLLPVILLLALAGPFAGAIQRHARVYGAGSSLFGEIDREEIHVNRLHLAAAGREMAETLPLDARILLIGEGRIGLLPRPALASSAYDRPDIARFIVGSRSVGELNRRLEDFTHVVVNFRELERFRTSYGFADHFGSEEWELFQSWLAEGLELESRHGSVAVYRIPRGATALVTHERSG